MLLGDNYYALVLIPIGILVLVGVVSYFLGLRAPLAVGLGILASLISILVIHRFHFENGKLIKETGNLYTSIYVLVGLILLLILFCYVIFKYPSKDCCCKEKGPEHLYENEPNSIDVHGYTAPIIENYKNDIIESTDVDEDVDPSCKYYKQSGFVEGYKDFNGELGDNINLNKESIIIEIIDPILTSAHIPVTVSTMDENEGLLYESKKRTFTNSSDSDS